MVGFEQIDERWDAYVRDHEEEIARASQAAPVTAEGSWHGQHPAPWRVQPDPDREPVPGGSLWCVVDSRGAEVARRMPYWLALRVVALAPARDQ